VASITGIDLSVIVPAYNEADRLPQTLRRFHEYLAAGSLTYEIFVVLDGSTDGTREVALSLTAQIENLKVVERRVNRGKGYTVRQGMLLATGKVLLFADADNSTDIEHFEKMKPLFDQGCDLVIASRNPRDAEGAQQVVAQVWYKRFLGQLGNRWVQWLAVPGIWDTQCGFKAFRREVAERIFTQATIDGWAFDIEALALARAMQYKIGIIAAHWTNDERSHVRWFDYFKVLLDTLKVRLNLLARRYRCG
jgi:dolichyl-phosphate beta-glucosyltransferase